jgi:hypothetical protein
VAGEVSQISPVGRPGHGTVVLLGEVKKVVGEVVGLLLLVGAHQSPLSAA